MLISDLLVFVHFLTIRPCLHDNKMLAVVERERKKKKDEKGKCWECVRRRHTRLRCKAKKKHLLWPATDQRSQPHSQDDQWLCGILNGTSLKCKWACCEALGDTARITESLLCFPLLTQTKLFRISQKCLFDCVDYGKFVTKSIFVFEILHAMRSAPHRSKQNLHPYRSVNYKNDFVVVCSCAEKCWYSASKSIKLNLQVNKLGDK